MSSTLSKNVPRKRRARKSRSRGAGTPRSSRAAQINVGDEAIETFDDVWTALYDDPAEAANLRLRCDLMIRIEQLIRRRKLTQAKAAKLLGVSQPRVSDLVRGKIELFSIDALITMLERAGAKVEVKVRAA